MQTANGGGFGSIENLRIPENESNVIVEVHYYDPGKFTHQQSSWSSNRIYKDIQRTGSDEERAAVETCRCEAAIAPVACAWLGVRNRPDWSAYSMVLGATNAYWWRADADLGLNSRMVQGVFDDANPETRRK
jgi:hypothetical protein